MAFFEGTVLLYGLACFASVGQFLFGYDQGVLAGILVNHDWLQTFNYPTETMQGFVVSIFLLGAWLTSYGAPWSMDRLGRRWTIEIGALVFIVGGILQTVSVTLVQILFGRLIAGFGIGFLSTVVPVYMAELSRAHNRGKVTVAGMSINMFGYACSGFIDYGFTYVPNEWSWRGPLLLQCVFAVILAVGCFIFPESPRFLVKKGDHERALNILARLHGKPEDDKDVQQECQEIINAVNYEAALGQASWKDMFTTMRRRSIISIMVQALAQLSGINIVTYYAPKMYERVLGEGRMPILMAGFTALAYFAGAVVAIFLVDRAGRRKLFMSGSCLMVIWLILMAVFNKYDLGLTSAILVIVFTMIYVFTFGTSWACVGWLYPAEIFPLRARAKGMSLAASSNWLCNFAVGLWTPELLVKIEWATYIFYMAFCVLAFVLVYFFFVETNQKSLEEIDEAFGDVNHAAVHKADEPYPSDAKVASTEKSPV
ncbi:general substrate transporter [Zychaea mexicana]|uniref:general substrate transporter n=1 Tax=Zychaea mexicana TaxID=64656 RepID=UPI0022FDC763|nr:general substrate transporter [Zychaea mexicana]KAI9496987.1 general substrate transporter [Zychaea mexicana]